ncbi:hypothetical protein F2Q69_00007883 [Brassica cretica]|uniref:Uncharacterized protein n=1 Tax=Brassica cretica TaxID=69181 RepID=A0A8S9P4L9_BRACR|nr:hypothetical protein F2Q69_00007883 [Brassica cretica]
MVDSEDRYSTGKASSVQSTILYDCEAEAMSKSIHPRQSYSSKAKWRYCSKLVQFHGLRSVEVLLDTPPGSPKNCPEAKGGSVRIHISPSRPVSVFMMKPRLCPSRDQSSPVKTFILSFGHVLSDQPAASRLEHSGAKPAHARHVLGWTSVQGNPLFSGSGRLRRTGSCPMAEYYTTV